MSSLASRVVRAATKMAEMMSEIEEAVELKDELINAVDGKVGPLLAEFKRHPFFLLNLGKEVEATPILKWLLYAEHVAVYSRSFAEVLERGRPVKAIVEWIKMWSGVLSIRVTWVYEKPSGGEEREQHDYKILFSVKSRLIDLLMMALLIDDEDLERAASSLRGEEEALKPIVERLKEVFSVIREALRR